MGGRKSWGWGGEGHTTAHRRPRLRRIDDYMAWCVDLSIYDREICAV